MDFFQVKMKTKYMSIAVILVVYFSFGTEGHKAAYVTDDEAFSDVGPRVVRLDHLRQKREAPAPPGPERTTAASAIATTVTVGSNTTAAPTAATSPLLDANATQPANGTASNDTNRTTNLTNANATTLAPAVVTQVPRLGEDGAGQRWPNMTVTMPQVNDSITETDDNLTANIFETPEKIQAEHHLTNLTISNHDFYNSTFIGNLTYFNEYWANISKTQADIHSMLSSSHRRATTVQLSFKFPFYGNWIQSITVATGGFIYTGEHTHAWLAATQYIAPLMANFDTSLDNSSNVRLSDDGEKFTAFWENVSLRESPNKPFTFAVTLYKNGDIVFAYKNVPIKVDEIDDSAHPVKIGISDAYLTDRVIFYVRRKTIYEYHRVSLKFYEITNNTILRLTALPTCLQYNSCESCLNHNTSFECTWCENIKKCSSGTDRNKQDWKLRNCNKVQISDAAMCPAGPRANHVEDGAAYVTDTQTDPLHDADVNTLNISDTNVKKSIAENSPFQSGAEAQPSAAHAGGVGGVVAALVVVTLVCSLAAWTLYAFKNPHTRSGQILIKYRPSQWSWRRGEARYTAATIHM